MAGGTPPPRGHIAVAGRLRSVLARRAVGGSRRPIGIRLSLGFLAIIALIGLIGVVALQRFSALTTTTTELSTHDLPEIITLSQLRTLLFHERDLARTLIRRDDPQQATDLIGLTATLQKMAQARTTLLGFEPPDVHQMIVGDTAQVQHLMETLARNDALARQLQMLLQHGQTSEASALEQRQLEPILTAALADTASLRALEQSEASGTASQVQQSSDAAIHLVLALMLVSLPLALALALLITRSLTRPLAMLLGATEALAAGNLDANPPLGSGDEIGQLAGAFETMRQNLRATIASLAFERRQVQAIIDASTDGVVLFDQQRTIVRCNPGAACLSGWSAADAVGRSCWEVFGCRGGTTEAAADHERDCPLLQVMEMGAQSASATVPARLRNGERRWFAVSCAPVPQAPGVEPLLVASIHDVSELKAAEQLKTDFVAMVSHELRAPLTTVAGSVELLGLYNPTTEPEAFQEVLTILDHQTRRLRNVIEEVLQVTRVEAGHLQVHLQPLALDLFLGGLLEAVRSEWSGELRPLQLSVQPDDTVVWADPDLLEIVLRNLLENARKYSPSGSSIDVTVTKTATPDRLEVRVIDHGPGIPEPMCEAIFERFSRGNRSSFQWNRGYGLGLYIAREIMTAHQGEIWAESHTDGACFVLSLWAVTDELPPPTNEDGDRKGGPG